MLVRTNALIALVVIQLVGPTSSAQAGPLIDWLFGGRRQAPAYPVGAPVPLGNGYGTAAGYVPGASAYTGTVTGYPGYPAGYPGYATGSYSAGYAPLATNASNPGYAANLGTYYGSQLPVIGPTGAGYQPQTPTGIAAATLPQTMSYVPNFNSNALRVPVTYYRPLLTTDPNTGSQVVAMAPCTSYQYLTQRVPALGQSVLYGAYQPPQPMQAIPSYTLPSGGIPLSSNSFVPSAINGGTSLSYSPYSAYQVSPPIIFGSPSYPSSPLGSSIYNNSPNGGSSCLTYSPAVPGLVAPPAATYSTPTTPPSYAQPSYAPPTNVQPSYAPLGNAQPSYAQPNYPSSGISPSTLPTTPGTIMPPPSGSFGDPGNTAPSLPPTGTLRPRIQSIVPESSPSGSESTSRSQPSERSMLSEPASRPSNRDIPTTNPIPAPEGMERPTWSPGLLRSEDMTALRPVNRNAQLAGQSKKIQWASFERELTLGNLPTESNKESHSVRSSNQADGQAPSRRTTSVNAPAKHYDTSGWKASR